MKLLKEREEKSYVWEIEDMTEEEHAFFKAEGLKRIVNDDNELINYAIVSILKEHLDKEEIKYTIKKEPVHILYEPKVEQHESEQKQTENQ